MGKKMVAKINKELLMAASIPIIFTIGVVAFFNLLPSESITLGNFISYISSLSTILMVLIILFTTSLQLNAVKLQLKEMESTRMLQTQPLPLIKPLDKSYLEEPRFFYSPPELLASLSCRIRFWASLENIGNGPTVAIDVVSRLKYADENGKIVTDEPPCIRINSLRQNEKKEIEIMFVGSASSRKTQKNQIHECVMRNFILSKRPSLIELTVFYKNVLGGSFKEKITFEMWFYYDDEEKIKSCLKLLETAKIDYEKDMRRIEALEESNKARARNRLLAKLNKELSKKEGCTTLVFFAQPIAGSFSVTPISEEEYLKEIQNIGYGRFLGRGARICDYVASKTTKNKG